MMANPDPTPIIVKTYASNSAIGYVVVQMVDGVERVVDTDIKSLTQQQRSLSAFQLEVAALRFAVDANSLLLSQNDYVVEADSRPLMSLRSFFK